MKVLIVEDCPELSFFWSEALSDMFKERIVASSTREAMTCLLRSSFDLVILDLFVEDGPTISLSDWIAMRSPDVPILMITGSHTMAHGEHTDLARGVTWLLRKPIKTDELRAMAAPFDRFTSQSARRVLRRMITQISTADAAISIMRYVRKRSLGWIF